MERNPEVKIDGWVYLTIFCISLLFLVISAHYHSEWPVLSPFFKELGVAGVIALILVFTIEKFTRQRHEKAANTLVEKINNNLFHAIYKRYIPEEVFSEVEKSLLKNRDFS